MQAIYSNNICIKCFDNVRSFCQFRKELINNQAILYQVFSADENSEAREEENFVDMSHAVKIKLEVADNDTSYHSNSMNFDADAEADAETTMNDPENSSGYQYQFKIEGHPNDLGIYSK